MLQPNDESPDIEVELAQLSRARINELRERWQTIFRIEPPPAFGPDLLRRSIEPSSLTLTSLHEAAASLSWAEQRRIIRC